MTRRSKLRNRLKQASRRELLVLLTPMVVLAVAAFGLTLHFVKPAPPKHLVIASGGDEGGSRWFARRYAQELKKSGVTLEIRESTGSEDSLRLLNEPDSGVDVAFVQGGTRKEDAGEGLVSLGSVSYVPLWIFYRGEPVEEIAQLAGRRIAVGGVDSGTRALAMRMLKLAKVDAKTAVLLDLDRDQATEQLRAGTIDVAFFVSPAESPQIKRLASTPGIRLLSLARAEAWTRRLPFLSKLLLPRAVFDLAADLPPHDVTLVAPTSELVVRDTLHPALSFLLLQAASQVHGSAGLLDRAGEFPSVRESGFVLSDEAERYHARGTPFLQRYLPFWAANLVDRMWVMVVPLIAVLVPLFRLLPPLYRWRMRSRIYRWYGKLKELELELDDEGASVDLEAMIARLDEIDYAVNHIATPLAYSENLYAFRHHLDLVRRRISERLAARPKVAA